MIFLLWTDPLGEVHNAKILARGLEFYSKAQANKVIKMFIIWLLIGKAREIERTSGEFKHLQSLHFPSQFCQDNKIQKRNRFNVCFWETDHLPLPKPNILSKSGSKW